MSIKSVGLFCAASETIDAIYADEASKVGALLGNNGISLFYGGAAAGLMEVVAKSVKSAGGRVIGVVPQILIKRNRVSTLLDDRIVTENLSDRKDTIIANSDIVIALPGGIGTLDELFHLLAGVTIGYHNKAVILYNVNGFWDSLLAMLNDFSNKGFVRCELCENLLVANSVEELSSLLHLK